MLANRALSSRPAAPSRAAAPRLMVVPTRVAPMVVSSRPQVAVQYNKRDEVMSNWEALRANPAEWYDNRTRKTNPKAPDFVRKDDRAVALWVDSRDTPDYMDELLGELDARQSSGGGERRERSNDRGGDRNGGDRNGGERRGGDAKREAEAGNWEALRNNPDEWYDNRNRKNSPRAPDFVRRDDRQCALWLDSYGAPEWVDELLGELDERQAARREQRQAERAAGGGEFEQNDERSAMREAKRQAEEGNWEALRANPREWYDNRNRKTSDRQPDFVRRDDRQCALWLDSRGVPEWVGELLAELDSRQSERSAGYAAGGQGAPVDRDGKREAEAANWEALRANPEQWFDNRTTKQNPKSPDFRRKDDRTVALWLTSYGAPEWVGELLAELDERQAARMGPR